jgi:hypothetical protein
MTLAFLFLSVASCTIAILKQSLLQYFPPPRLISCFLALNSWWHCGHSTVEREASFLAWWKHFCEQYFPRPFLRRLGLVRRGLEQMVQDDSMRVIYRLVLCVARYEIVRFNRKDI